MRAYARRFGEDEELYAVTGLVHDLDYERYPDLDTGHPRYALEELRERDYPEDVVDAVAGHAEFLEVPRETTMAKTLFAVDELSGFVAACALVRPTGIEGMKPKSVKKKLKQPSFAAAVDRDQVRRGAEELGVDFDEHLVVVIEAMEAEKEALGLSAPEQRLKRTTADPSAGDEAPLEGPDRGGDRARGPAHAEHARPRQRDQGRRDDDRRRRDPRAARGRGAGLRGPGRQAGPRPPSDRAPSLLLVLAALVGRDGARAHRRRLPGDQDRPARPRWLGEALLRLRDRRPGEPGRRGHERGRGRGRGRRRPLDGRRRRRRAGRDLEPARRPRRDHRRGRRERAGQPQPARPGPVRARPRRGPVPDRRRRAVVGLGDQERLRAGLRARLRHGRRVPKPRPGRRTTSRR